ncbi:MAG: DNA primase [Pseudomonadota bacterium]
MSLPEGFLDELRSRVSLADVAGRKVSWDKRKTNPAKGDFWAPCPFHQEKTASFHVDDKKGYYYCFGCQAKGDAINFVRETENMGFMEAVETLAQSAGLEMPARDPAAQARATQTAELSEVMEMAVRYYRRGLQSSKGASARDYLEMRRGLGPDAWDRWDMGFAPEGWQGLWDALRGQDVSEKQIFSAGLAKPSDKGREPYDVFRNRIMFPIRDARGRTIAFGGRAMSADDPAKYLNSPETNLFDKSRTLFNHGPARAAAGKGEPLVVAEGYMDVIALSEAGFPAVVAPLGTAITDHQLAMLWRLSPEPVVALDGDKAGLRAAMRLIDLAMPRLEAGKSLRFCLLPENQDPDDLLREQGRDVMAQLLQDARPLSAMLWDRETENQDLDSPERRASFDRRLRTLLAEIKDPDVRTHYGAEFKRLRRGLFDDVPQRALKGPRFARPAPLTGQTRHSLLAKQDAGATLREAVILTVLVRHPDLLTEFAGPLERMRPKAPDHQTLQAHLLSWSPTHESDFSAFSESLPRECLERVASPTHVQLVADLHIGGDVDRARAALTEEFKKLEGEQGLLDEIAEASANPDPAHGDNIKWRIGQAVQARNQAQRAMAEDKTEYVTGPNGAQLNKEERDALRSLLSEISKQDRN